MEKVRQCSMATMLNSSADDGKTKNWVPIPLSGTDNMINKLKIERIGDRMSCLRYPIQRKSIIYM